MAEVKKIATRDSYGNTLKELAAEGHDDLVVLDADLAAATKTGMFRKAYPDRHFDCGIAEGNMMGVAAGLATMGYVPFVSSFAMFAAGRAFEQIRNSIAYPRLNVKIGATHGGISVGEDGASHQCCEDFALMRSLPGMTAPQTMWRPAPLCVPLTPCRALFTCASAVWLCLCSTMRPPTTLSWARASRSPRATTLPSSPPV